MESLENTVKTSSLESLISMASELPDCHSGLTVTGIPSAAFSLNLWEGPELDAPSHRVSASHLYVFMAL